MGRTKREVGALISYKLGRREPASKKRYRSRKSPLSAVTAAHL